MKYQLFTAAEYARTHGYNPRKVRKALRKAGKKAPYSIKDLLRVRYETQGFGNDEAINPNGTTYEP
jgi:hypothetical protein